MSDIDQGVDVKLAVTQMLKNVSNAGLPLKYFQQLKLLVWENVHIYIITFFYTWAKVEPMDIKFSPNGQPVRMKL